jgi:hypothetical protein
VIDFKGILKLRFLEEEASWRMMKRGEGFES